MSVVLAFDIETVPDIAGLRQLHSVEPRLTDAEVANFAMQHRRAKTGHDFLPLHLQRVVAISCAMREGDTFKIWSLGSTAETEGSQGFSLGRISEVTRDELKFAKFIDRMRNKFSDIFNQALRAQCILKGICTVEEWDEFKEHIHFDFIMDNNFSEMKNAELMKERLGLLSQVDPYTGRYYSQAWIQRNVLCLNDIDITSMQKEIDQEKEDGLGIPVEVTNQVVQAQMMSQVDPMQQPPESEPVKKEDYTFNRIKRVL